MSAHSVEKKHLTFFILQCTHISSVQTHHFTLAVKWYREHTDRRRVVYKSLEWPRHTQQFVWFISSLSDALNTAFGWIYLEKKNSLWWGCLRWCVLRKHAERCTCMLGNQLGCSHNIYNTEERYSAFINGLFGEIGKLKMWIKWIEYTSNCRTSRIIGRNEGTNGRYIQYILPPTKSCYAMLYEPWSDERKLWMPISFLSFVRMEGFDGLANLNWRRRKGWTQLIELRMHPKN